MTSLDGEYILLGRQTVDTANIFVQYGFGATRTVNLTGGTGIQQAEFVDGLRLTVETEREMQINADLRFGIESKALPLGLRSLCGFLPPFGLIGVGKLTSVTRFIRMGHKQQFARSATGKRFFALTRY
jgi:hypothetical protein